MAGGTAGSWATSQADVDRAHEKEQRRADCRGRRGRAHGSRWRCACRHEAVRRSDAPAAAAVSGPTQPSAIACSRRGARETSRDADCASEAQIAAVDEAKPRPRRGRAPRPKRRVVRSPPTARRPLRAAQAARANPPRSRKSQQHRAPNRRRSPRRKPRRRSPRASPTSATDAIYRGSALAASTARSVAASSGTSLG